MDGRHSDESHIVRKGCFIVGGAHGVVVLARGVGMGKREDMGRIIRGYSRLCVEVVLPVHLRIFGGEYPALFDAVAEADEKECAQAIEGDEAGSSSFSYKAVEMGRIQ